MLRNLTKDEKHELLAKKQKLLADMTDYAQELLRKKPVQSVTAFEDELEKKFPAECAANSNLLRSGRVSWRNLTDWVKAHLTRQGLLTYCGSGDDRLMIYLECCGEV